ncbi:MAG: substrate-binding domain-containing protein [Chloroflexi bacterium]|jgi:ribose transport system substrate-binding protein|nr:substrate-binding domain-containing protein [Chloroflexota bacterium]
MSKKFAIIFLALLILSVVPMVNAQDDSNYTIAFVPGVNPDPFYITMASGVNQAASDLGVTIIQQDPERFDVTVSAPIIEALIARGDIDALVTAPNDRAQSIPVLQEAYDAGIPVITVDTFIGDGNYADGEVTFPLSYIGSDNTQGGYIACTALADALGEGAKIYIQNVRPGISTTDQREDGCEAAAADRGLEVVRIDYNDNSADTAQQQTSAVLQANPDITGIFATNTFGALGAGSAIENAGLAGAVQVALFDASEENIGYLRDGTVSLVIAQKPSDMGYLGVALATAYLDGFQSLPKRVPTGYFVFTAENVDDPANARFIYSSATAEAQPRFDSSFNLAFVPGVNPDPFYITMSRGVNAAAARYGITVIQQDPERFDVTVSAPIIEALVARGDINALVTAPNDRAQSIPVLQEAFDAGIPVITVDTFIGDGNYLDGEVTFPLSYIGSDNTQGGYIACSALADALGEGAKIYIQNVRPGISTTDQREDGCEQAAADRGLEVVRIDYNDNSADTAQQQTAAVLQANADITGVFATNTFGALGAGAAIQNAGLAGAVQVALFDASEENIGYLRDGTVSLVIAQKPADMGYLGVIGQMANARGVTSMPERVPTGYFVFTSENVDDPANARFIYSGN